MGYFSVENVQWFILVENAHWFHFFESVQWVQLVWKMTEQLTRKMFVGASSFEQCLNQLV